MSTGLEQSTSVMRRPVESSGVDSVFFGMRSLGFGAGWGMLSAP